MARLRTLIPCALLALGGALIPASTAHADIVDVWTTYSSMHECKTDLLHLNDYCYGLQDGRAIGFIDAALTVDELDQAAGLDYDDENVLPAPESSSNPVVEVWNNTADFTFIGAGTSVTGDLHSGVEIYYIPPGEDLTGGPIDAAAANID